MERKLPNFDAMAFHEDSCRPNPRNVDLVNREFSAKAYWEFLAKSVERGQVSNNCGLPATYSAQARHDSLHVIRIEVTSISMLVAELTHAQDPQKRIAEGRRKGGVGRLMDDPLRRNVELVAPD